MKYRHAHTTQTLYGWRGLRGPFSPVPWNHWPDGMEVDVHGLRSFERSDTNHLVGGSTIINTHLKLVALADA
jgi:hypothetical protein